MLTSSRWFLLLLFGVAMLQFSCGNEPKKTIETAPITFTKEGELVFHKAKTDSVTVKMDIEIANSDYETQTGLMYRNAMEEQQGMLFVFSDASMHSFYMKNTQIPLDLLFVDGNFKVVHIHENAKPFNEESISSKIPVQYVLEINAGLTAKWGLAIGDSIEIVK